MNSEQIWARFEALRDAVQNESDAAVDRIDEIENEWEFLYDAACDESEHDGGELTDEQYDSICHFHHDHITNLTNWGL